MVEVSDVRDELMELRWHGRGGQGVVTASHFLAEAALLDGRFFQSLPEFGAERSGAPLVAYTRISSRPVLDRSPVLEPHIVAVLDPTLLGRVPVAQGLKAHGTLLVNSSRGPHELAGLLGEHKATVVTVDATRIVLETLGRNIPNIAMLGALVRICPVVSKWALTKVIQQRLGERLSYKAVQANLAAFERGNHAVSSPAVSAA
ncbi:MAG: 2-oxoacid:acceptor oxidoreductase family protein [Chloroflexi bacterium]|nr:2-oxoacid:acceptor oxidoreductase family protein [Chloroflexota bacterium]